MITIPITYTGLTPSLTEDVEIVSGQRETLAVAFSFSEDWSAYKLRTAMFSSRTATRAQMIEEDGTAVIPSEVIRNGERYVKISAFGTLERADGGFERYNGRAITLRIDIGGDVEESGGCTDATAYEKLLVRVTALEEKVDNLPAGGGGGGGGGSSVALDTTLTKPGYAADAKAVGDAIAKKLDAEKLPAAVETALAEAKESGEFDGPPGQPGDPGTTPHIGANGNWWIGTTDTGVKAQGEPGQPGTTPHIGANGNWWIGTTDTGVKAQGEPGQPGTTPHIGANGNWWIGATDTGIKAQGEPGQPGDPGSTPHIGANGNWWIGETDTGVKAQGEPGQPGAPGDDYVLTDEDIDEIASAAAGKINISGKADVTSVPNSATVNADNELVMQHTDGNAVAELFRVALPAGGGGSEWEVVQDVTLTEDVAEVSLGNGVSYKDVAFVISPLKINNEAGDGASGSTTSPRVYTDWTYAIIDKMPINSNSIIVITSLLHGGARVNNLYKHSANNYYYLTNGYASSYYMPTRFTEGVTTVSYAKITTSGEWLLKSGCRVTLYGRK